MHILKKKNNSSFNYLFITFVIFVNICYGFVPKPLLVLNLKNPFKSSKAYLVGIHQRRVTKRNLYYKKRHQVKDTKTTSDHIILTPLLLFRARLVFVLAFLLVKLNR